MNMNKMLLALEEKDLEIVSGGMELIGLGFKDGFREFNKALCP